MLPQKIFGKVTKGGGGRANAPLCPPLNATLTYYMLLVDLHNGHPWVAPANRDVAVV